ncbi:MAG: PepSY domain-containing protein [Prevotellaceae bacterium]|jgi:uncharacterized iron-regulated membrane protein|nr:PepSY domain-containing protein [Prevotellaceae bacterium]
MKKIIRKIHLWIAFPIGIIITIICLTGAILVFRPEIEESLHPERFFAKETHDKPMSLTELIPLVNSQLENNSIAGVTIPNNPKRNYIINLTEGFRAAAYVNPYTGKLIEITKPEGGFFTKIMQLHRWLLDDTRKIGKPVVGYSTLLFVIILITGIIIIFPKTRKSLKRIFTIHINKGWTRFWYDMHISAGVYVVLILLVLALSGLTWSFRWYSAGVYNLFGVELPAMNPNHGNSRGERTSQNQQTEQRNNRGERTSQNQQAEQRNNRGERPAQNQQAEQRNSRGERNAQNQQAEQRDSISEKNRQTTDFSHWQEVFEEIKKQNPDFKSISIQNESASVSQKRIWGNARASDRYAFDAKTGVIKDYLPYSKQEKATKIRGWIYTLHVGAWGGLFSKIITFIAALTGASLPITGYYFFCKKRKKRKKID